MCSGSGSLGAICTAEGAVLCTYALERNVVQLISWIEHTTAGVDILHGAAGIQLWNAWGYMRICNIQYLFSTSANANLQNEATNLSGTLFFILFHPLCKASLHKTHFNLSTLARSCQ